jgi:hypothetical protein
VASQSLHAAILDVKACDDDRQGREMGFIFRGSSYKFCRIYRTTYCTAHIHRLPNRKVHKTPYKGSKALRYENTSIFMQLVDVSNEKEYEVEEDTLISGKIAKGKNAIASAFSLVTTEAS